MKILLGCMFLLSSFAMASSHDEAHRPKSFNASGKKIVFVNYKEITYQITYDVGRGRAHVVADMLFNAPESGYPVFDTLNRPNNVTLNGKSVRSSEVKAPQGETEMRIPNMPVEAGENRMTVEVPLKYMVSFGGGGVRSAFWNSDLNNRGLLERYVPANFEFDRVKKKFIVNIVGAKIPHTIYSNGTQKSLGNDIYEIDFPSYFTSSSIFFHVTPTSGVKELKFDITSISGKKIPATIYTLNSGNADLELTAFKNSATKIIAELENDYGPYPHPSLIVYAQSPNGGGGMEYAGSAVTSLGALGHELLHSFFGRALMPANGNAGWIDEAIASWRDRGYPNYATLDFQSKIGNMPYYTRWTDVNSYDLGSKFMGYMNNKLGGIKPFLADILHNEKFKPIFTEEFIEKMEAYYGKALKPEFTQYVQNDRDIIPRRKKSLSKEEMQHMHPIHKPLSEQELLNLL